MPERKERTIILFFCLGILSLLGCGEDPPPSIDLNGWNVQSYVQEIPMYTRSTEDEIRMITSVVQSFESRYGEGVQREVSGMWIIRNPGDPIPCLRGPNGTACVWIDVNGTFGFPDTGEVGLGGLAYLYEYLFVAKYGGHSPFFSLYIMHELGHILLKLKHDTDQEKVDWCVWEDEMWLDWTHPLIEPLGIPGLNGTAWSSCHWI